MEEIERGGTLRTIFAFFLGLMLTSFVGGGVYTFHPPPDQFDSQIRDLTRREQEIRNSRPPNELTAGDRDQIQQINRQRNELTDAAADAQKPWGLSTSVILIVLAKVKEEITKAVRKSIVGIF